MRWFPLAMRCLRLTRCERHCIVSRWSRFFLVSVFQLAFTLLSGVMCMRAKKCTTGYGSVLQGSTLYYDLVLQGTILYYEVLYGSVLQGTTLSYKIRFCTTSCHAVLRGTILFYKVPLYTTSFNCVLQGNPESLLKVLMKLGLLRYELLRRSS